MPRYLVLIALIAAVLLAAGSPVLAETWYEHYAAAEKALADGEWRLAVEQLNTALEKKGDSGVRVRTYGMKFTAYFPYLKLGIAYYELGQLDAALQAFETEERLGAIAGSEKAVQDLARYRELTTDARQAAQAAEAARIEGIVNRSMGRAKEFENEGRLEEAIGELGTAVAVSPDQPDALAMLSRLRAALARRQEEADTAQRTATLVEQGRAHLAAGDLAEAASVLRQALSLTDSEEVRGLLAEAQGGLLEELESLQVARRAQTVTEALSAVSKLEAAGRFSEALDRLQSVLVLDPGNQEAITLEERLLEARESTVRNAQRRKTIDDLLASVDTALASGDVGSAMTTANRILGLDPSNESALAALASAYRILNGQLLPGKRETTVR
jgi:tetratricopeptide (TPR) repeat protein